MAVRVVTDSAAGLPADMIAELGIEVLNLHVMEEHHTAGLSALELAAAYGRLEERAQGDGVLAIHLSKELSSTWSAAETAAAVFPDTVRVIDSGCAGMVMGAAAMSAARLAQQGADLAECEAAARDTLERGRTWLYVHSTEDLRRSGRLSATTAMLSTALLATRPILAISEGKLELVGKTRTQTKAYVRLVELVAERAGGRPCFVALQHSGAEPEDLKALFESALPTGSSFLMVPLTDVLAAHMGEGIGISVIYSQPPVVPPKTFGTLLHAKRPVDNSDPKPKN